MAAPLIQGALSGLGSLFGTYQQGQQTQAQIELEKERARQEAIAAATRRKTDYLPLVIVGSVVVVGSVIALTSLNK